MCVLHLILLIILCDRGYDAHFTDKKNEVQIRMINCLGLPESIQSQWVPILTISQGKMFAPTEERRDCKRLQQEEDEDMKSKREMLAIVDEWRKARRLQSRRQQKPNVRDPCKGPFPSIQEEGICENLESKEDEEINSQIEMCPPAGEWWGFNKPRPRRHQ